MNKIKFLNTKNFFSFKIDNFLSKEIYEELDYNFPAYHELKELNEDLLDRGDKKYVINPSTQIYHKLLNEKKIFKHFFNSISSKEFFFEIYNQIFSKILISKISSIQDTLKLLRFSKFSQDRNILEKFFFKNVKINHEISFLLNGAFLKPHTDSRSKLCSILIYFPSQSNLNPIEKEKEKKIGTQFWDSELDNYENSDFQNFEKIFEKKSKRSIKTEFEKYSAFGFLKNNKSWHSVDKIDINNDYIRRSININLNYY